MSDLALRIVYRSHGGENTKDRPGYYSKLVGLVSFLRALEGVEAEVVYVNDGPIPADRLRLMEATGTTVELPGVGMRGSYRAALEQATSGRWSPDDLVWFSEDDYLYLPGALQALVRAADAVPEAEYFALYGSTPAHPALYEHELNSPRPAGWRDLAPWRVDGQDWVRIYSTTSSFAARIGILVEDLGIFRFCMVPHKHMLRDHDTFLALQGFEPYRYRDLARDAVGLGSGSAKERLRAAALVPFLLATNLRVHRRATRRRLLLAADPNLATHMETELLAGGSDWEQVARETVAWGRQQGMLPAAPQAADAEEPARREPVSGPPRTP